MKRVQTKLTVLGVVAIACLAVLAGLLIRGVYAEYVALANFQRTTQISVAAYDLARLLTIERQMAYQASSLNGEGTAADMVERYRVTVVATREASKHLKLLAAGGDPTRFSERFRKGLDEVIGSEAPLDQIREEIFDPKRSLDKADALALKTKTLKCYDVAFFSQSNFLPILALESNDAELVRKINTQDNVARLQKDFWKIKGLVGTVLRDNKLGDSVSAAEIKTKRLSADDHVARLFTLSDPVVTVAVQELVANVDYVFINAASDKIVELGASAKDFHGIGQYADYQGGAFKRVELPFAKLADTVIASISAYTDAKLREARQRLIVLTGFSAVTLAGLAVFIGYVARGITRPLRELSTRLADTAGRGMDSSRLIAESSHHLSEDACSEAAALEQITASVEELSSMTGTSLDHMQVMSGLASKATQLTDEGKQNVDTLTDAMAGIQKTSSDIAAILRTIDEIAFQTNILALNAAVEAARAGEAGAGFAVVADEVRRLAQRSAQAAQETREKIEVALKSNDHGADIGRVVQERFVEIAKITREYSSKVAEVEAASAQSTQGLAQVKDALGRLDQITQRTAAAAEQNAAASAEMSAEVENIFRYIETLESMVAKSGAEAPAASVAHRDLVEPASFPAPGGTARVAVAAGR